METKRYFSKSESGTYAVSKEIYKDLSGVCLILLKGDLGVGKTVFVKGIAKAMGIEENITSPTYGIKNCYDGLIHYDLYLSDKKVDLGNLLEEDMENALVIIEWGDKLPKKFAKIAKTVEISLDEQCNRLIEVY